MKSLLVAGVLLLSTQVFAVTVELGQYIAKDKKTQKEKIAEFTLKADGTADMKIKASGMTTKCNGKYTVKDDMFHADVKCKSILLPETSVDINVSNLTPEGLRTAPGVLVTVMLDVFDAPEEFYLMKNDPAPVP
jgi:hypothetical protein